MTIRIVPVLLCAVSLFAAGCGEENATENPVNLGVYTLRIATPGKATSVSTDELKILRFIDKHRKPATPGGVEMVLDRGDGVIIDAIRGGNFFLIEDPAGNMMAGGALFLVETDTKRFVESGSALVPGMEGQGIGGFEAETQSVGRRTRKHGIHEILIKMRSVYAHIAHNPSEYFGIVQKGNKDSARNMESAGFDEWKTPDEQLKAKKELVVDAARIGRRRWYRLRDGVLPKHAEDVHDWVVAKHGKLELKRTNSKRGDRLEVITLEIDIRDLEPEEIERLMGAKS